MCAVPPENGEDQSDKGTQPTASASADQPQTTTQSDVRPDTKPPATGVVGDRNGQGAGPPMPQRGGAPVQGSWRRDDRGGQFEPGQRDRLRAPYARFSTPSNGSVRSGAAPPRPGQGPNASSPWSSRTNRPNTRNSYRKEATPAPVVKQDPPPFDPVATKPLLETTVEDCGSFHFLPSKEAPPILGTLPIPLLKTNERKFNGLPLMVRDPFVKILGSMNAINEAPASKTVYIDGKPGSGRSTTIAHTVYAAKKLDWLTLYVPRLFRALDRNMYIHPDPRQEMTADGLNRYDQPEVAQLILGSFREANRHLIKDPILTQTYTLSQREIKTKSDTTFLELVGFGIDNYLAANDVLTSVLQELRLSKRPVLFALDEFNGFFYKRANAMDMSTVADPNKYPEDKVHHGWKYCKPHQMNVIRGLASMFTEEGALQNGITVTASSSSGMLLPFHKHKPRTTYTKTTATMEHTNWELMGMTQTVPMERISVEDLSRDEIKSLMNYYRHKNWVNWPPSKFSVVELDMMTASNSKSLVNLCDSI